MGYKNGKKIYRTTISIKIPSLNVGDIFYFEKQVIIIKNIYMKLIIMSLSTYLTKSIDINKFQEKSIYLGNKFDDVNEAIIVSIEKNMLLILDINTYITTHIEKPNIFNLKNGDSIKIFKCEHGVFIII